jgi:hypothetical protein
MMATKELYDVLNVDNLRKQAEKRASDLAASKTASNKLQNNLTDARKRVQKMDDKLNTLAVGTPEHDTATAERATLQGKVDDLVEQVQEAQQDFAQQEFDDADVAIKAIKKTVEARAERIVQLKAEATFEKKNADQF